MATRTGPAPLAAEREQVLVTAVGAAYPGEALAQIAALQVAAHHVIDNRTPVAVSLLILLLEPLFKGCVMLLEQLPQRRLLRLPGMING